MGEETKKGCLAVKNFVDAYNQLPGVQRYDYIRKTVADKESIYFPSIVSKDITVALTRVTIPLIVEVLQGIGEVCCSDTDRLLFVFALLEKAHSGMPWWERASFNPKDVAHQLANAFDTKWRWLREATILEKIEKCYADRFLLDLKSHSVADLEKIKQKRELRVRELEGRSLDLQAGCEKLGEQKIKALQEEILNVRKVVEKKKEEIAKAFIEDTLTDMACLRHIQTILDSTSPAPPEKFTGKQETRVACLFDQDTNPPSLLETMNMSL